MTGFCKNENCPSSTELLEYQNGETAKGGGEICRHLSLCEFCEAEFEFYSTYPLAADESASASIKVGAIPRPLYELAEALLRNRHSDGSVLNSLLKDKEKLVSEV